MIKKVEGGYKVVSEKGNKNLGSSYKTKKEARRDCSKWNSSCTKKADAFHICHFMWAA